MTLQIFKQENIKKTSRWKSPVNQPQAENKHTQNADGNENEWKRNDFWFGVQIQPSVHRKQCVCAKYPAPMSRWFDNRLNMATNHKEGQHSIHPHTNDCTWNSCSVFLQSRKKSKARIRYPFKQSSKNLHSRWKEENSCFILSFYF